ncbi:MAG: bifunctional oligoribonuclease/PAP phosphatase NrnA [bacterium]
MIKDFKTAFQQIKQANNILLVTHFNPDGDAMASLCAMIEIVESYGKKYTAYCSSLPSQAFSFLPHIEKVQNTINDFSQYDLIISLDCGSLPRTRLHKEIKNRNEKQYYIEFDHHPKMDDYANLELRDPTRASTTEQLYFFFQANNIEINSKLALCILTGIVTDTGNFFYPVTSQETISIASEMLRKGAKLPKIVTNLWYNKRLSVMKLWGLAMSRLQINKEYNIAFSVLTLEDFAEHGATEDDIEGVSGFLSNLKDVKAVLLLRESTPGIIMGSLRTNQSDFDVSILAQKLGGGGHPKASGFSLTGSIKKVGNIWQIM